MKKISSFFFIVLVTGAVSCKKDDQPQPSVSLKTTLEIDVKDGNSFVHGKNDSLSYAIGATVKLYESKTDVISNAAPRYVVTTDAYGKALIEVDPSVSVYFFTVEKGTARNIVNSWLIKGVYTFQDDPTGLIKPPSIPTQTPAPKMGSALFFDANNDNVIQSPGDDVYADYIIISVNDKATKKSIIF